MKNKAFPIAILALSIILLVGLVGFIHHSRVANSSILTEVTTANFEEVVLKSKLPVYVEFYTKKQKCEPCEKQAPVLEKVAAKYAGKVLFVRIDALENQDIAAAIGIQAVPTHLFLKVDEKIALSAVGVLDDAKMHKFIEAGLNAKAPTKPDGDDSGPGAPTSGTPDAPTDPDAPASPDAPAAPKP